MDRHVEIPSPGGCEGSARDSAQAAACPAKASATWRRLSSADWLPARRQFARCLRLEVRPASRASRCNAVDRAHPTAACCSPSVDAVSGKPVPPGHARAGAPRGRMQDRLPTSAPNIGFQHRLPTSALRRPGRPVSAEGDRAGMPRIRLDGGGWGLVRAPGYLLWRRGVVNRARMGREKGAAGTAPVGPRRDSKMPQDRGLDIRSYALLSILLNSPDSRHPRATTSQLLLLLLNTPRWASQSKGGGALSSPSLGFISSLFSLFPFSRLAIPAPPFKSHNARTIDSHPGETRVASKQAKCDEISPRCTPCTKHRVQCSFTDQTISVPDTCTAKAPPFSPSQRLELELLHHFTMVTSFTLSGRPGVEKLFQTVVIRESFESDYLLHGLLSMAAFHMAYLAKDRSTQYLATANAHYNTTIELFRHILAEDITAKNCNGIFACASLIFVCSCARPRDDPPEFPRVMEWFTLLRGVAALINPSVEWVRQGPLAGMISSDPGKIDPGMALPCEIYEPQFEELLVYLSQNVQAPGELETYRHSVMLLRHTFHGVAQYEVGSLFWWPTKCSTEYMSLLGAQKPEAMLVLAYYCAMLHRRDSRWWIKGWPEYMVHVVQRRLCGKMSHLMRWPLETMGVETIQESPGAHWSETATPGSALSGAREIKSEPRS
ncbi:hypothetical protein B2J93_7852 [Marssonina coronariae]|uniref:Transcription factor Cys n=1 Tax=Diplocarpon coronariae TaxID=2795749 RepID=A0A218ZBX6_9HELO|nr:hypothetical protein B2J93_7852 [Marssonina coronariae]